MVMKGGFGWRLKIVGGLSGRAIVVVMGGEC